MLLRTKVEPEVHSACLLPTHLPSIAPQSSSGLQAKYGDDHAALVRRLQEMDERFEDEMAALASDSGTEGGGEEDGQKYIAGRWQDLRR